MNSDEKTCIKDLKKIIVKSAASLIKEAADNNVFLSFNADKIDDVFSFYKEIKNTIKTKISENNFDINMFKISSIISLSLCRSLPIKGESEKQTEYYNFYLSLLVSEQFIKQFSENGKNGKFIKFKKSFFLPTLKMIKRNSSLINNTEHYKSKDIILTCVINLSHHYHLLYDTSREKA